MGVERRLGLCRLHYTWSVNRQVSEDSAILQNSPVGAQEAF